MSEVSTLLKVMPVDDTVDLDELTESIEAEVKVEDTDTEPVAFGLKALKVLVKVPDDTGGTEEIVSVIEDIEGVKTVEVESVTRE